MQVTSTQLNTKTKRDDSGELSRFFVLFGVLLFFITSCSTDTTNEILISILDLVINT
jgi:hypothetical protein